MSVSRIVSVNRCPSRAVTAPASGVTRQELAHAELDRIEKELESLKRNRATSKAQFDIQSEYAAGTGSWGLAVLSVGLTLIPASFAGREAKRLEREIATIDARITELESRKLDYIKLVGIGSDNYVCR
jgi:hypothetical protein